MSKRAVVVFPFFFLASRLALGQKSEVLQVEKFQLENGLTVYLNPDSSATNIFGAVLINAGSINESPEATGMSHYLEHMLFKGTDVIGTLDFKKEKIHYDSIVQLYEQLETATDKKQRSLIQSKINEESIKSAEYILPNDFSNLLRSIGSTDIGAFAGYDITFYHNYFPSHQIEKWLDISAQRFINPVFRTFQSELEVVYEEKNRYDDDFQNVVYDELLQLMYPNYAYGLWPTIGRTKHLKNPSLTKIHDFFDKHYVAKNMALLMSGNFDSKEVRSLIEESKFLDLSNVDYEPQEFQDFEIPKGERKKEIAVTPLPMGGISYYSVNRKSPDRPALDICEYLLSNDLKTGLLDQLELSGQINKIYIESDLLSLSSLYSIFFVPKEKENILDAKNKVIESIIELREGLFSDELLASAKLNALNKFNLRLENLEERSLMIAESHYLRMDWSDYANYSTDINSLSKHEILRAAKKYFSEDYGFLISRKGSPRKDKLKKPSYKAIETDQNGQSPYAISFRKIPQKTFTPRFIDFDAHETAKLSGGHILKLFGNPVNNLFKMDIRFKSGLNHNPKLAEAVDFVKYLGAGNYTAIELKREFERIGCSYTVESQANETIISFEGIEENLDQCLRLIDLLLVSPIVTESAKQTLINDYQTNRSAEYESPFTLGFALIRYGVFDSKTKFLQRTPISEIGKKNINEIIQPLKKLYFDHLSEITYVGNRNKDDLIKSLETQLNLTKHGINKPTVDRAVRDIRKPVIYLVEDKKARQNQVYFYIKGNEYRKEDFPLVEALNTYLGDAFTGVVFQEIREYRSLAYSTFARLITPNFGNGNDYLVTGFGCQSDKTMETIDVMNGIISEFPIRPGRIEKLKEIMIQKINTKFPSFRTVGNMIHDLKNQGYVEDPNISAFEEYQKLNMNSLANFYNDHFKNKPSIMTIYGNPKHLDLKKLSHYGQIIKLDKSDIMIY